MAASLEGDHGGVSLDGRRIFVAGHRGMVGQAIVRALEARGTSEILTVPRATLDLRDRQAVRAWLERERPDTVFVAAAKVGGILANDRYPVDFLMDNLELELALIRGAFEAGVERLVFLGSSCIYPKFAEQPIREDSLLTGPLEPTNEWYAVAKIAGIKMCQALRRQYGARYVSVMPTNLYGPGDNFDLTSSHVLPALIRKAHEAKARRAPALEVWGTGTPRREFLHADDCASGILHVAEHYDGEAHVNCGSGTDVSIRELAETVAAAVGFHGDLRFDATKPDGTPRKLMDSSRLFALGWRPRIALDDGIRSTYEWFLANVAVGA
jgi:GDP-L-fucose synthase